MGAGDIKGASDLLLMPSQRPALSLLERRLQGPSPPFVLVGTDARHCCGFYLLKVLPFEALQIFTCVGPFTTLG